MPETETRTMSKVAWRPSVTLLAAHWGSSNPSGRVSGRIVEDHA